jgi:hypothetical protein
MVKRIACVISPVAASSYFRSPGRIGSPAASAYWCLCGIFFDLWKEIARRWERNLDDTCGGPAGGPAIVGLLEVPYGAGAAPEADLWRIMFVENGRGSGGITGEVVRIVLNNS